MTSLNYCHSCTTQNCVDISELSDEPAGAELSPSTIPPTGSDLNDLLCEFQVLVSRYVCYICIICYAKYH